MTPREKLRAAVVAAAAGELGPGRIPDYWASCGVSPAPKPGTPTGHWCGAFTLWCLHQAKLAPAVRWIIGRGFCEVQGLPKTRNPLPGDIAYTDKPYQHHAIVESWDGTTLVTIDGNQPDVRRRSRPMPAAGMVFYSIDKFLAAAELGGAPTSPVTAPSPSPTPARRPPPTPPPLPEPDAGLARGIDVSHHQAIGAVDWEALAKTHRFAIVRATYGIVPDASFPEHVRRARDAGLILGAYAFFRPGQHAPAQLEVFGETVEKVGMGPGWLPPTLDVEQNETYDGAISADRYAPAESICAAWRDTYGAAMVYTNPSMWAALGSPGWLWGHYLWIAHYGVKAPKTPLGLSWVIWQHKVAPLPGVSGAPIDQNVARSLPLLQAPGAPPFLPLHPDWDAVRRDRDAAIRDDEDL